MITKFCHSGFKNVLAFWMDKVTRPYCTVEESIKNCTCTCQKIKVRDKFRKYIPSVHSTRLNIKDDVRLVWSCNYKVFSPVKNEIK